MRKTADCGLWLLIDWRLLQLQELFAELRRDSSAHEAKEWISSECESMGLRINYWEAMVNHPHNLFDIILSQIQCVIDNGFQRPNVEFDSHEEDLHNKKCCFVSL